jgi:hypothetical protein
MDAESLTRLIEGYLAAWKEPKATKRRKLLDRVWEENGEYTDPLMHAPNRERLEAYIERFLADNPGASFSIQGKIEHHNHYLHFFWSLRLPNGSQVAGMDYGEVSPAGKLKKIVGFF